MGFPQPIAVASGGGAANSLLARKFPWTSSTPGLFTPSTGWSFYTPSVGDLIHDIWLEFDTLVTATAGAARMDVGFLSLADTTGWFRNATSTSTGPPDCSTGTNAQRHNWLDTGILSSSNSTSWPFSLAASWPMLAANLAFGAVAGFNSGSMPVLVTFSGNPMKAIISSDGTTTGGAVTPSGAGTIYLITSTPA